MSLGRQWNGCQEAQVVDSQGHTIRALAYTELIGTLTTGMDVHLNSTALDRGLGTGGYAMIVATHTAQPHQGRRPDSHGHLVKARYTPTQAMVLGVDEQESEHHDTMREATSLDGMPVITTDLHSALPAIVTGIEQGWTKTTPPTIAYVMTDGGALPAWFSRTVDTLRSTQRITSVITTGQAFGGDFEAATLHTGLLAARHVVRADIAIVIQGPGNLGTGTPWGFSGIHVGEVINATHILGGHPIAALRLSGADARPRHQGISHHSLTAIGKVALAPATVICPQLPADTWFTDLFTANDTLAADALSTLITRQIADLRDQAPHHTYIDQELTPALHTALHHSPVTLSTMGRGYTSDPLAFLAVAAAGQWAATHIN